MGVEWSGPTMQLTDPVTGQQRRLFLFVATLLFSRYAFVEPALDMRQDTWLRAHVARPWRVTQRLTSARALQARCLCHYDRASLKDGPKCRNQGSWSVRVTTSPGDAGIGLEHSRRAPAESVVFAARSGRQHQG